MRSGSAASTTRRRWAVPRLRRACTSAAFWWATSRGSTPSAGLPTGNEERPARPDPCAALAAPTKAPGVLFKHLPTLAPGRSTRLCGPWNREALFQRNPIKPGVCPDSCAEPKIERPRAGYSGPALRELAAGGDSPPRMLLCIELIVSVKGLLVHNFFASARKLARLTPLLRGAKASYQRPNDQSGIALSHKWPYIR